MEFENKTVVITGGATGIGWETARAFLERGANVVLNGRREMKLQEAITGLDPTGKHVAYLAGDIGKPETARQLVRSAVQRFGGVDILVNNAGIAVAGRSDHVPQDRWEMLMQVNLLAPMRLSSLFVPAMVERGSGHIVNVSSVAGWIGAQGLSSYCASKFGLRGFSDSLAYELDGTGVRVTTVFPCFSRTPILDSPQYGYDERREVPEYLVSDPADVVANIVKGIRRNRRYVYPDRYARLIQYVTRLVPWAMPFIDRRLAAQSRRMA